MPTSNPNLNVVKYHKVITTDGHLHDNDDNELGQRVKGSRERKVILEREDHNHDFQRTRKRQIHTVGSPRLSPIPPNAETSSNRTRKRSNHFIDSSRSFARSMIATMNTAHTSHHMSGRPLVSAGYSFSGRQNAHLPIDN